MVPTEQAERNPIDAVAEEFADKCRRGLDPSVDEYVQKYPHIAKEIRELLPTVAMMEQLKSKKKTDVIPQRLGEYQILGEIGRGGMGTVYEAEHKALGRKVALKVAPRNILQDHVRRERFLREAQAAARLHHTNIVPVFGAGEANGLHYIAMQYIAGCGLNDIVTAMRKPMKERGKPLPHFPPQQDARYWRWAAQLGVQVADALGYAHDQGTLHRDIKPANIILDSRGTAWVADFGLAKIIGRDDLTQPGDIIGTVQYMAPEALRSKTDTRSDLYSLGATLYELVTLRPPYKHANTLDMLKVIGIELPPAPREINPDIPADLECIIVKAMTVNQAKRYQTAREFAEDLRLFLAGSPPLARHSSFSERAWHWCRRNKSFAVAPALVLAGAAGLYLGMFTSRGRHEPAEAPLPAAAAGRGETTEAVRLLLQTATAINVSDLNEFPLPPELRQQLDSTRELRDATTALQNAVVFYEGYSAAHEPNAALDFEAVKTYARLADLQRRVNETEKAADTAQRGLKRMSRLLTSSPENPDYNEVTAMLYGQLANALQRRESLDAADENFRKSLALYEALVESSPRESRYKLALASQRLAFGDFVLRQHRYSEAKPLVENAIAALRAGGESDLRQRQTIFRAYKQLAEIYRGLGDQDGEDKAMQDSQRYRPPRPNDRPMNDRQFDRGPDRGPNDRQPNDRFPNDRQPNDRNDRPPNDRPPPPRDGDFNERRPQQ
jgi:serine/threonine protein kinase